MEVRASEEKALVGKTYLQREGRNYVKGPKGKRLWRGPATGLINGPKFSEGRLCLLMVSLRVSYLVSVYLVAFLDALGLPPVLTLYFLASP